MPHSSSSSASSYARLQGDWAARVTWARQAAQAIDQHFREWGNCARSFDQVFRQPRWGDAGGGGHHAGRGAYGTVHRVFIRALPDSPPVAVKRSNDQEVDEARRMVLVSALVEGQANPHFALLFVHHHCEEAASRARTAETLTYAQGVRELDLLEQRRQALQRELARPDLLPLERARLTLERDTLPLRQQAIKQRSVPTPQEIAWASQVKRQLVQRLRVYVESPSLVRAAEDQDADGKDANNTSSSSSSSSRVPLPAASRDLLRTATALLDDMLVRRQALAEVRPYELLAMEYADGGPLRRWMETARSVAEWHSCVFQVSVAVVSLLSYFGLVQNDLNLHNVLCTAVPRDAVGRYQLGTGPATHQTTRCFRVPWHGWLFKVIDFGLATNVTHTPYCVGAVPPEDANTNADVADGPNGTCTPWARDLVEFAFRLLAHPGLPPPIRGWLTEAHAQLVAPRTAPRSSRAVATLVASWFANDTARRWGLPQYEVDCGKTLAATDVLFYVTSSRARRQRVMDLALRKRWLENPAPAPAMTKKGKEAS